jgi:hypothetical protein
MIRKASSANLSNFHAYITNQCKVPGAPFNKSIMLITQFWNLKQTQALLRLGGHQIGNFNPTITRSGNIIIRHVLSANLPANLAMLCHSSNVALLWHGIKQEHLVLWCRNYFWGCAARRTSPGPTHRRASLYHMRRMIEDACIIKSISMANPTIVQ